MGVDWVDNNGPGPKIYEKGLPNGHHVEVFTTETNARGRTMPELQPELDHVVNAFDPWARDRGEYYSLAWKPRPGRGSSGPGIQSLEVGWCGTDTLVCASVINLD